MNKERADFLKSKIDAGTYYIVDNEIACDVRCEYCVFHIEADEDGETCDLYVDAEHQFVLKYYPEYLI